MKTKTKKPKYAIRAATGDIIYGVTDVARHIRVNPTHSIVKRTKKGWVAIKEN